MTVELVCGECPCCGWGVLIRKTETYQHNGESLDLDVNECPACHESFEAEVELIERGEM